MRGGEGDRQINGHSGEGRKGLGREEKRRGIEMGRQT